MKGVRSSNFSVFLLLIKGAASIAAFMAGARISISWDPLTEPLVPLACITPVSGVFRVMSQPLCCPVTFACGMVLEGTMW
jgi:hypothetical protein